MVELLAPAGGVEALHAAIEAGANAVYLAGDMFGARAYANNFDREELSRAIQFAHKRDVHIHVTVNTIARDEELEELAEYLRYLDEIRADAALVQDLGVAKLARKVAPQLPLHASTQMSVHSAEGVQALARLGFSRVVLAREMTMEEIRHICAESPVEIEAFMHGALCVCYSGQCLMSSMIGGRSGNRGRCAQPCRLPYTLVDEHGKNALDETAGQFLLSPRDLNTLDVLPDLIRAGVSSLKIEGRMKRPEYVATVVSAYRKAIDAFYRESDSFDKVQANKSLAQIFNRDFTTAYLLENPGKNMMSDLRPNNRGLLIGRVVSYDKERKLATLKLSGQLSSGDQLDVWVKVGGRVQLTVGAIYRMDGTECDQAETGETVTISVSSRIHPHDRVFKIYDAKLMEKARSLITAGAPVRRFPISCHVTAKIGEPLHVEYRDEQGNIGTAKTSFLTEAARKNPLTEDRIFAQVNRLGTSPFEITSVDMELDSGIMVPVSEINRARREAIEQLEAKRLANRRRIAGVYTEHPIKRNSPARPSMLMVAVDSLEKAQAALEAGADGILFGGESYQHAAIPLEAYKAAYKLAKDYKARIDYNTPRILKDAAQKPFERLLEAFSELPPDAIHIHSIGTLSLVRRLTNFPLHADYSLISYNRETISSLEEYGVTEVTASPELNLEQLEELVRTSALPVAAITYGRLELMISEYCVMGSFLGNRGQGVCSIPCTKGHYSLKDRKGAIFPLYTDEYCRMHLLNSKILSMLPYAQRLRIMGVSTLRIEAKALSCEEISHIVSAFHTSLANKSQKAMDKEWLKDQEGDDITRGHYFRGVL